MTKAGRVLVTGSRFYGAAHFRLLREAGFIVSRFEPSTATTQDLSMALHGKRGYLWGGIEKVTEDALVLATELEAVSFPGSGYTEYIPAWEGLTRRGVAIAAAIGENAPSVGQYTISLILSMLRVFPALEDGAPPSHEFEALTLAVVGIGNSGRRVAALARNLGMQVVAVSRGPVLDLPPGVTSASLNEALKVADVVTLHVNQIHGHALIGRSELRRMKKGALLVNVAFPEAVDVDALATELHSGRLRAAFDSPPAIDLSGLPLRTFVASRRQAAYNTLESNQRIAQHATRSLIALLTTGSDASVVNPEYERYRAALRTK
jgi:D-3-phosphoglycerate dehydrogenase